jgi:coniferyl-aldehyde dehydrogenase
VNPLSGTLPVLHDSFHRAPDMARILASQRQAFAGDMTPSHAVRTDRLRRLLDMTERHGPALVAAISSDFGHRSPHETRLADLMLVAAATRHAMRHLRAWMKPRRAPTALHYRPGYSRILRQPLGVVGVVAPWNYPYQLAMGPAVGAIAAGNRVMIKPSELTPAFSALLQQCVAATFAEEEMAVVTGDADVAKAFVELPFDHLVFTGSTSVGRLVAQAAARNLTPVTLELGGKSPAILDASCDFHVAAPRLIQGKLLNAGQTCIAPDYALVPAERTEELVSALLQAAAKMYPGYVGNADYTAIINARHYARLQDLVEDARARGARVIALNGVERPMPGSRKMVPAIVLGVTPDMKIMQEEIFGPLLPVMTYRSLDDAIGYINRNDRPLALYWFGKDRRHRDQVLAQTISGGVTINDCLWHFGQENMPFGGVGASGNGAYHGEFGLRTFSKEKPVFFQPRFNGMFLLYPPYGKTFERMATLLKRIT